MLWEETPVDQLFYLKKEVNREPVRAVISLKTCLIFTVMISSFIGNELLI